MMVLEKLSDFIIFKLKSNVSLYCQVKLFSELYENHLLTWFVICLPVQYDAILGHFLYRIYMHVNCDVILKS
jgi:hypothetical protein